MSTCSIGSPAPTARSSTSISYSKRSPGIVTSQSSNPAGYARRPVWVSRTSRPVASRNATRVAALPNRLRAGTSPSKRRTPSVVAPVARIRSATRHTSSTRC
ncbi:hypothetical protein ACIA8B_13230 [Micromonospora chalcea]